MSDVWNSRSDCPASSRTTKTMWLAPAVASLTWSALIAILTEWERNTSLVQRVNNLKTGIAGGIKLNSTTVQNDHAHDTVCDSGGHDWLLVDSSDGIRRRQYDSIISYLNRSGWDLPGH